MKFKESQMVIEELVKTVLSELKQITQTETVIGEPITAGGVTVIPVSKVSVGFGIGGGKAGEKNREGEGTGGGVMIEPVAFIVIREKNVELLSMKKENTGLGQVIDLIPEVVQKIKEYQESKTRASKPREKSNK
jgi:sporulation protein YtfJ